jgi:hypothetical protein
VWPAARSPTGEATRARLRAAWSQILTPAPSGRVSSALKPGQS